MAEVCLTDVCKIYAGDVKAVDCVSLTIADGEFVVLVGPSGCGKSTTLRMVAGLEEISTGTITIGGKVVNDVPPKDRDIAMVFQNYALYPYMSVYENMAFGLKLRRRKLGLSKQDIDAKVREVAATLGLTDLLKRKPGALSGGQRQRVAVGRAIVRSPRAFLFDEPLSNLDAKLRVEMRAEIKKLHRRLKTTTIYVTHDQEEAMTLGDRLVVMDGGVVQQCATPLEVYRRPTNRFVAGFVGSPPMNFIDGNLRGGDGGLSFEAGNDCRVGLASEPAAALHEHINQAVVMGVRPEALRLSPQNGGNASSWTARVLVIEPLGEMMDVQLSMSGDRAIVARVPANTTITEGITVAIEALPHGVHFFETGSRGANLTRAEGSRVPQVAAH